MIARRTYFTVSFSLILFFIFGLTGCASVGGQQQVIAVDSSPRGLEFSFNSFRKKDSSMMTPAAVMVDRRRTLQLTLGSGDFQKKLDLNCNFRKGTVLLGNAPVSLLLIQNPAAALVFYSALLSIDLLSGAAFECPYGVSQVVELPSAVESELAPTCNRVLILPPARNNDLKLEKGLIEEAQEYASRMAQGCIQFVSQAVTTGALIKSSIENGSIESLFVPTSERKWAQLLRDTGATRAVDVHIDEHGEKFTIVTFSLWDLFKKEKIASFKKTFRSENFEKLKGGFLSSAAGKVLKLIPNSIAVSQSSPSLNIQSPTAFKSELIGRKSSLLGLVTITSVEHPDQFDEWDGDFQISPSLYFDSIRHSVSPSEQSRLTSSVQDAGERQQFRGYAFNLPVDGVLSLHTPAGAFRVFIGFGLGSYYSTARPLTGNKFKLFALAHGGLDWVAYFGDNFFAQVGLHAFSRGQNYIEQRGNYQLNGWNSAVVGLGYFFPSSRGILASLFN
ncbi:MAG: hypothetical protein RJB13_1478 [Pseudomonadota bacterium]